MDAVNVTYAFYVQLLHQNGSHLCGGTILSSFLILTAAHCFDRVHYNNVRVLAGQRLIRRFSQIDEDAQILGINEAIIHDGYNLQRRIDDIALVVLNGSFTFRWNIASVSLPKTFMLPDTAVINGWTNVSKPFNIEETITPLMVNAFGSHICNEKWGGNCFDSALTDRYVFGDSLICTAPRGADGAWLPDPGSPIVCTSEEFLEKFICGIVSAGHRRAECGSTSPNLNLRVDKYYYWIMDTSCYDSWRYQCPPGYFRCGGSCVPPGSGCNDVLDCGDGSSERECGNLPVSGSNSQGPRLKRSVFPEHIPFRVQLQYQNGSQICGGTILSDNLVLSAAHCFDNHNCSEVQILVESSRENEYNQIVHIKEVIIHAGYNPDSNKNDIAILVLNETYSFGLSGRLMAYIPSGTSDIEDSAVVGHWEDVPKLDFTTVKTLGLVEVNIFNSTVCKEKLGDLFPTNDTGRLCALGQKESETMDACHYDSGGPLMCSHRFAGSKRYVCGIVSSVKSKDCRGNSSRPMLFVQVSSYYGWIINRTCLHRKQYACPDGYFRCCNDFCVPVDSRCDGVIDCADSSDEKYCPNGFCKSVQKCHRKDTQVCPDVLDMPDHIIKCGSMINLPEVTKGSGNIIVWPENMTQSENIMLGPQKTIKSKNIINVSNKATETEKILEFTYKSPAVFFNFTARSG